MRNFLMRKVIKIVKELLQSNLNVASCCVTYLDDKKNFTPGCLIILFAFHNSAEHFSQTSTFAARMFMYVKKFEKALTCM